MKATISALLLLLPIHCIYTYPFAAGLIIHNSQSRNHPSQSNTNRRNPLFIHAEEYETDYIHLHEQCLQANNCKTNQEYRQIRKALVSLTVELRDYIEKLENETTSNNPEKDEAENIKKRLLALLNQKNISQ